MNFIKIAAITSRTTGIAHTCMAAEATRKECKKRGYTRKVEMQRALGIEDKLSEKDIKTADLIVFANGVGISKTERLDAYKDKIVGHTPHQVIQKSDIISETPK